jgi:hypothetical protein
MSCIRNNVLLCPFAAMRAAAKAVPAALLAATKYSGMLRLLMFL